MIHGDAREKKLQLTPAVVKSLRVLLRRETRRCRSAQLAPLANLSPGCAYNLLDRLVFFGWATSDWDEQGRPIDFRGKSRTFWLTPRGCKLAEQVIIRDDQRIAHQATLSLKEKIKFKLANEPDTIGLTRALATLRSVLICAESLPDGHADRLHRAMAEALAVEQPPPVLRAQPLTPAAVGRAC